MSSFRLDKQMIFLAVGAGVVAMSFIVMLGWWLNISVLTSVLQGFPTMKFNTALAFALSGTAMMLVYFDDNKRAKFFYIACAASAFIIGILTLMEVVFDFGIGIDALFFTDPFPPDGMSPYPGRMVGSSALSFAILGLAFLGLKSSTNRVRHWAQYSLHIVTFFASMALMGYCFHLTAAYKVAHFTSMAIHTSLAFIALSVTLSFYNSDMGIIGLFTGKGLGNEMARKLFPAIALTGLVLGYVRIKMFNYHLVSLEFGVAFAVLVLSSTTLLWIWITAKQLNKLEVEKKDADEANYKLSLDIASAQKLEKQKDEINKRNLLFVQQAPSAIAMFDTDMRYIAASEQWIKDYGLHGLDIIGNSHYDIFPEIGNEWKAIHQKCMDGAIDKCEESRFVRSDGTEQWITWDIRPWYDSENKIGGLIMYTAEISHLKKNEALLKEMADSLADAQEIAHVGSWDWNVINDELKWSDEQYRIFGSEPQSIKPRKGLFTEMMSPQDSQIVLQAVSDALQGLRPYHSEFKITRADGSVRDIEAKGKVFRDKEGKPLRMVGTLADITERKKLGRELKISEKEFRSAFENSASGMAMVTPDFKWTKINEQFCKMVGYSEAELRQMSFPDITHPDDVTENVMNLKRLISREIERYQGEKRYIHKNGSIVWALLSASVVFDSNDAVLYFVAQITDITEEKKMESKLKSVNSELSSIFNAETHVSIVSTDLNGIITHFSKGAEILLGYKASELIGHFTPAVFHDPAEVESRGRELSNLLSKEVQGFDIFVTIPRMNEFESREWTYLRKDGLRLPVQMVVSPTKDADGNIKGYLGIATDITERKVAEQANRNNAVLQSRNKEMEEFAYIASHDLQEPLRTVTGFINLLTSEYREQLKGDGEQYVRFIAASTTRMSNLIKGLLEFSRIGKQKLTEPVDCNRVMREVTEDMASTIHESNAIVTIDELPVVNAFPEEMKQLLQNLLSNAIKFRKPGIAPVIHISALPLPGYWQFEVSDNGLGIDPLHYAKIFIMFQRLHGRDTYPGTGIGLSYCKKIVELHHGRIWVESEPGAGSRFFFTISNTNA